ncbi:multidrug resistance-associated ABC transporter [Punctularia strigosozonata HHB-11173 SS5]|uniref:multidrug resistance-associated ABC transporter n=1 Tax=Punctularia strigosozonata (strain HHB-11173) TaxID=741275 RepID=UPI00044170BD|nr:multidrug resistance-associated ABC transporter [Punctularia strigosozonata HHB-11173 SS5]EIN08192.1 multidrug resistance-associated ABC transporter [Punctularia strigosozonata HHB-11173 SS5]
MPEFQLPVAVVLAAGAVCSLVSYAAAHRNDTKEGKIKLPAYASDPDVTASDAFNVTKPEDIVEGEPLDERQFWTWARLRKLVLSVAFFAILIIQAICLGWAVFEGAPKDIAVYSLHVAFAMYLLVITALSLSQKTVQPHSRSVQHLSSLTILATFLLGVTAILPETDFHTLLLPGSALPLWYTALALYLVSCVVAITTPCGPRLHFPPERIYSEKYATNITNPDAENVCGVVGASVWDTLLFSYTTKVVMLGNTAESLDIGDLPIVPANMRAPYIYAVMKSALKAIRLRASFAKPGSGIELGYRLVKVNLGLMSYQIFLAAISACLFYTPAFFLQRLVTYLESDPTRSDRSWGWVFCAGLFFSNAISFLITGQLWSISTTTFQVRLRIQLNTILFAKTLVRKDVASSAASSSKDKDDKNGTSDTAASSPTSAEGESNKKDDDDESEFSSKAQVMTLMTTDVDRVSEFAWHLFSLVDAPIEIVIGSLFLYKLLGVSCFIGLAVTCLFLPLNHFAGKIVVKAQDNLMSARDERVALMNEILGAIRMLKFMAWERSFEKRVLEVRDKELRWQRLNYTIESLWNAIWNGSPLLVTLVSFWHFTVVRGEILTPSIAFPASAVFSEMKFALNALPETLINMLQSLVSLRRIEKYLNGVEVTAVPPLDQQPNKIAFQNATVTWPQERGGSAAPSAASTPRHKFLLMDLTLDFPIGELSLICGKLGSGKTLLLLSLLGEVDILAGQVVCPRSPPDAIALFANSISTEEEWIVQGICAYVPQSAWLRNASIKDNILFNLPYVEKRYQKTLEVCALVNDLQILEDGDESEIGERGVNLSGGQKARVSLARAVYSRASTLLLDDVLSAVDAHTAHHLFTECLKGELMRGRTVVLVSHHVQLCAPGAGYIVALDNGRVQFQGDRSAFQASDVLRTLIQSGGATVEDDQEKLPVTSSKEQSSDLEETADPSSETSSTTAAATETETKAVIRKGPRKLVEEEKRAVGRIGKDIWLTYIKACGGSFFWTLFIMSLLLAALSPVFENGWLRIWSRDASAEGGSARGPVFYITVYAIVTAVGLVLTTVRWFILYHGSIHASTVLYKRLLEAVLFAHIRFHDTVSRGRLLNRFGKDFEGIDSSLADNFGRSIINALSVATTFVTICYVGGLPFFFSAIIIGLMFFNVARVYSQTSRDMRRLDSVTRSPLYSLYGETISGVAILRAFGASTKFLRDMLKCVDTNANPYYWMWGVNRWLSIRFNLLSSVIVGLTGLMAILTPSIDASLAGFALAFASTVTNDILFMVRRFVGLEQSMVALERVKEYSELPREPAEFIEPRPPSSWPEKGAIKCEDLVIRYAPELPNVLHNLNFEVQPGEKVGILGRTGSGKSTLALSFFRFVEATEGKIVIDGLDISQIGLTDLRSKLTIIPQDPTILSGTLRSTLDVFNEYQDAEIYEALRRVHLIPAGDAEEVEGGVNANIFRNLDSPVSEGGENFSTGEKQLLCMARAILKRSRVLVMDEATASVDYATDELIGKTIRQGFADSTILTIAHRLRTVIDYNRVMVLDQGRMVEFDSPKTLLSDPSSKFYSLCKATGKEEFAVLKKLAGV